MAATPDIKVGNEVTINGKPQLGIGLVKFVGNTQFQTGTWIGIELSVAEGKNDGSVQGVRYFSCKPNFGIFVRENQVTVIQKEVPEKNVDKSEVKEKPTVKETQEKEKASTTDKTEKPAEKAPAKKTAAQAVKATPAPSPKVTTPATTKTRAATTSTPSTATTPARTRTTTVTSPSSPSSATPGSTSPRDNNDNTTDESEEKVTETSKPTRAQSTEPETKQPQTPAETTEPKTVSKVPSDPPITPSKAETIVPSKSVTQQDVPTKAITESPEDSQVAPPQQQASQTVPAQPAPSPSPAEGASRTENVEKLMRALKELNEFKIKAQDTIRVLQQKLKETAVENDRLNKETSKINETHSKEIEKLKKDYSRDLEKIQKQLNEQKTEYEEQVRELSENLEMTTLDKEIAEEKAEQLEQELERFKQQESIQGIGSSQSNPSEATQVSNEELEQQNQQLKEALMKLRDLSVVERQEKEKKIRDLERETKQVPVLQEKIQSLEKELKAIKMECEELKEAVDAAHDAEDMIEKLSEKNSSLEEQIKELEDTVEELEALRDISQELEENQAVVEKQLRSELYAKEIEILDLCGAITNLKNQISGFDRLVQQFRLTIRQQQEQLLALKQKEADTQNQASELSTQSQALMNLTHQLQASAVAIDQEIAELNLMQAQVQTNFIKDFLPQTLIQSDLDCMNFSLLIKRFIAKSRMVVSNLQHYQQSDDESYGPDEALFYSEVRHLFTLIGNISSEFELFLVLCEDTELYAKVGKLQYDLVPLERQIIDPLLNVMREENLTRSSFNIEQAQELCDRLEKLAEVYLSGSEGKRDTEIIRQITLRCSLQYQKLCESVQKKGGLTEIQEIHPLSGVPAKRLQHIQEQSRKLTTLLQQYEPTNKDLDSLRDWISSAKQYVSKVNQVFHMVAVPVLDQVSDLNLVGQSRPAAIQKITEVINHVLSSTLAAASLDTEWQWMAQLLDQIYSKLNESQQLMMLAPPVQAVTDKDLVSRAYIIRSSIVKAELADASNLKNKIDVAHDELLQQKKLLQQKETELQDTKWKEQALEKKIARFQKNEDKLNLHLSEMSEKNKTQEKMYEEALDAIQKDVTNLTQENRALKDKILQNELKQQSSSSLDDGLGNLPHHLFSSEIRELRNALQFLKSENARLKGLQGLKTLNNVLPPLLQTKASDKATPKSDAKFSKDISQLLQEVQSKLASTQVVPLGGTTKPTQQIAQQRAEFETLQTRVSLLKQKVQITEMQRSASKDTSLCAVVKLPMPAQPTTNKVVLDSTQFQQLHAIFAN